MRRNWIISVIYTMFMLYTIASADQEISKTTVRLLMEQELDVDHKLAGDLKLGPVHENHRLRQSHLFSPQLI